MALTLISNSGKVNYNIKEYIADSPSDLPVDTYVGSTAYIVSENTFYMFSSSNGWEQISTGAGGGEASGFKPVVLNEEEVDPETGKPLILDPNPNAIYFVPTKDGSSTEWMYINNKWEKIGSANVDLTEIKDRLNEIGINIIDIYNELDYINSINKSLVDSNLINSLTESIAEESEIGTNSLSLGGSNIISGHYSYALGADNVASGDYSFVINNGNTASNTCSFAGGIASKAEGDGSIALGNAVTASGPSSYAQGSWTQANGRVSHAEGDFTIANGESQHVEGSHNIPDTKSLHIVGNGFDIDERSNAYTLDWNGNGWFAGDVYVGSTSGKNKDEGSKKLITADEREVYSYTPTLVGTWVDGLPIYRQVFKITEGIAKGNEIKVADYDITKKEIIKSWGMIKTKSSANNAFTNSDIAVYSNDNGLFCKNNFTGYADYMYIVIEYTFKMPDFVVVPTEPSGEEKFESETK